MSTYFHIKSTFSWARSTRRVAISTSSNKSSFCDICFCFGLYTAVEGCCRTKLRPVTKYTNELIYILIYIDMYISWWVCFVTGLNYFNPLYVHNDAMLPFFFRSAFTNIKSVLWTNHLYIFHWLYTCCCTPPGTLG